MGWNHPIAILAIGCLTILGITSKINAQYDYYPRTACREDQYQCRTGSCISRSQLCDNVADCPGGDDEENCQRCRPYEFECGDGTCLSQDQRCDNVAQCSDRSDEVDCDYDHRGLTEEDCSYDEFFCDDSCHPRYQLCNGHPDCLNRKDEENCSHIYPSTTTPSYYNRCPEYTCPSGKCFRKSEKCDSIPDCEDGYDERDCCRSDQFKCNDNTCVDRSVECNGRQDCPDGSDEANCVPSPAPSRCQSYQWPCTNGQCVNAYSRCDGRYDCSDSSDEMGCPPTRDLEDQEKKSCGPNTFRCENGPCIPNELRCDKHVDCPFDISDELDCGVITNEISPSKPPSDPQLSLKTYPASQIIKESREVVFRCRDEGPTRARVKWSRPGGRPLPPGFTDKNGRLEIPNIRIEDAGEYVCEAVGYPSFTPGQRVTVHLTVEKYNPLLEIPPSACGYHEATCMNGECISKTSICDGIPHCSDGSDEHSCSYGRKCNPNQFLCKNSKCVDRTWRCDGENDCGDNSDEESCDPAPSSSPCRYDEFQCKSGHCIPKTFHCDRTNDCIDGSDEHGCTAPAVIQSPPPRVTIPLGGILNITCRATGVPVPIIVWRRNWGHVPEKCSSSSTGGYGSLYCPDMQNQDSGAYSCEVINVVGTIFVVPDTIVIVETDEGVCPAGYFNVEAVRRDDCINCFCFGVSTECKSADLFVYHLPPPVTSRKVVLVNIPPYGDTRISDYTDSELINLGHGIQFRASNVPYSTQEVPYLDLPPEYQGNQLKSYGGSLKYEAQYIGRGRPITAPDVILIGNGYTLQYRHPHELEPNNRNPIKAQFIPGSWVKQDGRQATREEIMMTLASIEHILIRLQYIDSTERQVEITYIIMDSAVSDDKGLGSASLVEQCTCPTGYSGFSCESCAPGYVRQRGAPWLGRCVPDVARSCPSGTYGDPNRNIPCRPCPCPIANTENNFARECTLGPNNDAVCSCLPGYVGKRCEICDRGYEGNPTVPGGSCRPISHPRCDPAGTELIASDGSCQCKQFVTGTYCDMCKPNSFHLNDFSSTGCIECFCSGVTKQCTSSSLYRDTIHSSFSDGRGEHGFKVISNYETSAESDVRIIESRNELQLESFSGDVLYWGLPEKYLGDKVTAYGGNLNYTVRYNPLPGGVMSRNVAPDVVIKSANGVDIVHYRKTGVPPSVTQSYSIPIVESAWERSDGITINREHLLMTLADIDHIFIKATYTTVTQDAGLSHVSLDTAIQTNIGSARAVEVEQCACPPGYLGLSCEDCAPGYKRSDEEGLYLGVCEPCDCNGHSTECEVETGRCYNCRDNTDGDHCDVCAPGYEGDAKQGSPYGCRPSTSYPSNNCENCNPNGTRDCAGDQCICKQNVEGVTCSRCRLGTFNLDGSNRDGCSECFCSGTTTSCTTGSFSREEIPVDFLSDDRDNVFTLNNYDGTVLIDSEIEKNVEDSHIAYNRPLYSTHFWSLPTRFLGNQIKSYGGRLQFTLRTGGYGSFVPDQDIILLGNGVKLIWTRPRHLENSETISVALHENEGWLLESGQPASRRDILTALSNLDHILIRANPQGSSASYSQIRDITLETAVKNDGGRRPVSEIEQCYCPREYTGSSCESCAPQHYRNISQRVGEFGACLKCPCNEGTTESCSMAINGYVQCYCINGYSGDRCEIPVSERPIYPIPPSPPATISVTVSSREILILDVGQSVTLECNGEVIATKQPINVFWYRLNNNLPDTAIWDGGRLYLRNLQIHDSGIYVCQARKDSELVEKKISVTVEHGGATIQPPSRPAVELNPSYIQVEEYRPAEAYCLASGNPTPYVTWSRIDGRPLSPYVTTENGLIRFTSVQRSDEGAYRCSAQNEIGTDSGTLEVYVISGIGPSTPSPPRPPTYDEIYISPSTYSGYEGDLVQLTCNVRIGDRVTYRWLKDNQDVYANRNIDLRENILIIQSASPSDSAVYTCSAYSPQTGATYSTTAYVSIEGRGGGGGGGQGGSDDNTPQIKPLQNLHTIVQGQDFSIDCEASGSPYPKITWTKLHETLDSNIQQVGGTLTITNAVPKNRGVYLCIAENSAGTDQTSISVDVEPRERPLIEIRPREPQYVRAGESAALSCQPISGIPTPNITWQRVDRRPLSPRARTEYYSLIFDEVLPEDAGEYECHAQNVAGHTSAVAVIHVSEPPQINLHPANENVELTEGDELRIKCTGTGNPPPNVKWRDEERNIDIPQAASYGLSLPSEAVLEIYRITNTDSKIYTCVATNSAGSDTKYVYVHVKPRRGDTGISDVDTPTVRPLNPHVYTADIGDNSTLSCRVDGVPKNQTRWERIDGKALPRGSYYHDSDLIIPVISDDAIGVYECVLLENGRYIPLITAELTLIPIPRISFSPPMPMTVRPGENVDILCNATGERPINVEWYAENHRPLPSSVEIQGPYLRFYAITPDDAGRYFCLASNKHGNVTKVAEVLVNRERISPPSTATRHEVFEGQGVSLDCSIPYGTPNNVRFNWRKENGYISQAARYENNRLVLSSVRSSDEGRYICEVIQPNGAVSVNHVDLIVKPRDSVINLPILTLDPPRSYLTVGDSTEVECVSSTGIPTDIVWERADGRPFPRHIGQFGSKLVIRNAQLSDSGEYICKCRTDDGYLYTSTYELGIQDESRDSKKPQIEYVEIGKNVKLTCEVDEFPSTFKWSRQFGQIQSGKDTNSNELRLDNVQARDAGTYICTVTHDGKSVETPTILVVTGAIPHFPQAPLSYIMFPQLMGTDAARFSIEITFKPERSNGNNGLLLYVGERKDQGNFLSISLNDGHPEARYNIDSVSRKVRSERPISMGEWHTVKIFRNRRDALMYVDDQPPVGFPDDSLQFKQSQEYSGNLYIGGFPEFENLPDEAVEHKTGFIGCVSYLVVQDRIIEINEDAIRKEGVTSCEPCAEDPCQHDGVCLESQTELGYTCVCRRGFTGRHCTIQGNACTPGVCGSGRCENGEFGIECFCPLNKTGDRCQYVEHLDEASLSFKDGSYAAYKAPKNAKVNITFHIRPANLEDSVVLYIAESKLVNGDFLAVIIKDKHIELKVNYGGRVQPFTIRSPSPIQANKWTEIHVARKHGESILRVGNDPQKHGKPSGTARFLNLRTHLYIGGYDKRIHIHENLNVTRGFDGCISNLRVNYDNVHLIADVLDAANVQNCGVSNEVAPPPPPPIRILPPGPTEPCFTEPCRNGGTCVPEGNSFHCICPTRYSGKTCQNLFTLSTNAHFSQPSYLELDNSTITNLADPDNSFFVIMFSTTDPNGLLLWQGQDKNEPYNGQDFIAVALIDGQVELAFSLDGKEHSVKTAFHPDDALIDGRPHIIVAKRAGYEATLETDKKVTYTEGGASSRLTLHTPGPVFLGGAPNLSQLTGGRYRKGFNGCVHILENEAGAVNLSSHTKNAVNVEECSKDELNTESPVV